MPDNPEHDKHMMPADRDHAWRRVRRLEFEPVGREPELADVFAKDVERRATAAESAARTAFGMLDDTGLHGLDRLCTGRQANYGFHARIVADNRAYLVGTAALALGLVVMLGTLFLYGPGWLRPATSKITVNNASWCADFSLALSCENARENARK